MGIGSCDSNVYPKHESANIEIEKRLEFFSSIRAMACNEKMDGTYQKQIEKALLSMYEDGWINRLVERYSQ